MNPPSVYELTNPSSHSTNKITNIVQSIGLFLSVKHTYLRTSHFRCAYAEWKFLWFLQRCAQIPVVRLEQAPGRFVIALGHLAHDPHGPVAQFRARGVQSDHEIAAHFPQSEHSPAGDHSLHKMPRCAKGGGNFARVQNADASAASRADVK